jgi:copper resistance protein D
MQVTYAEDRAAAAAVVERFGRMAVRVVALLLAAGTVLLVLMLQRVSDLWSSDYGRLLLLKLVLVTTLLSAAAINKLKLTPRLKSGDAAAFVALRHSIAIEMALGAAILLVTALFTTVTGPGVG